MVPGSGAPPSVLFIMKPPTPPDTTAINSQAHAGVLGSSVALDRTLIIIKINASNINAKPIPAPRINLIAIPIIGSLCFFFLGSFINCSNFILIKVSRKVIQKICIFFILVSIKFIFYDHDKTIQS